MRNCKFAMPFVLALLVAALVPAGAYAADRGTVAGPEGGQRHKPAATSGLDASAISESEPDNDIDSATELDLDPGSNSANGSLSAAGDYDDVYAVYLYAGEKLDVSFDAQDGTDFGLYLFGPEAWSVWEDEPVAGVDPYYYGGPDSYPLSFSYTAPEAGWYFLDAWTWDEDAADGGSGTYSLSASLDRQVSQVQLTSKPATLNYGGTPTISGVVVGRNAVTPSGTVFLYYSFDGLHYVPFNSTQLSAGAFSVQLWPVSQKMWFQAVYEGNADYVPSVQNTYYNAKASLTSASASRTGTRTYKMAGYLKPKHTAGSTPVRIYLWRYVNGAYKAYGYKNAKAYDYTNSTTGEAYTKYSYTYTFPYKGKWRMRAYHSDSGHVATYSGYSYVNAY